VCLLFHDVYRHHPRESGFCSPGADRYKLTLDRFEDHLLALTRAEQSLPFLLTFDDGGASFYTMVADRVEALGWRAHCFVPTDTIGRRGFMTRREIQDLDRRGHLVGSHTASHPARISVCRPSDIVREWTRSRALLEDVLGHEIVTASVPGGFYSRRVADAAVEAGIRHLFTSEPVMHSHVIDSCEIIGRFAIRHTTPPRRSASLVRGSPWPRWAALADWKAKALVKPLLGTAYVHVADWLMARTAAQPPLISTQEKRP
jgi:peptidoglycan/xylan/chitin deacetylase (PgdA/CDA1 family)